MSEDAAASILAVTMAALAVGCGVYTRDLIVAFVAPLLFVFAASPLWAARSHYPTRKIVEDIIWFGILALYFWYRWDRALAKKSGRAKKR